MEGQSLLGLTQGEEYSALIGSNGMLGVESQLDPTSFEGILLIPSPQVSHTTDQQSAQKSSSLIANISLSSLLL